MLNEKNERELAYVVSIDAIEPIVGSDNCEAAVVGGWKVMVRKGTFKAGDLAIYFEIDSQVPATETYAFLEKKHYKVKSQRYTFGGKGNFISQGLLMAPEDFGWWTAKINGAMPEYIVGEGGAFTAHKEDESRFLTKKLGITYATVEDNSRKAKSPDKYKKMAQRHGKLFAKQPFRWMMKHSWGKKLLFIFYGKKKDTRTWPQWVKKTDEERIQNMPWILENKEPWIVTEKIDGTSTTFSLKKIKKNKYEFYVCSRNVLFDTPDKKCYYDTNVYLEMSEKYGIENSLRWMLENDYPDAEWITLQGETYGQGVQKRDYSTEEHCFMGFNLITSDKGRLNSVDAAKICMAHGIPWVPIVDDNYILPDTVDELLDYATGSSVLDGKPREGFVFRSQDGVKSFKAVSNAFLLEYHS